MTYAQIVGVEGDINLSQMMDLKVPQESIF